MNRAIIKLQYRLRELQRKLRHRRGSEADIETNALNDCEQEYGGDERPDQNKNISADLEKPQTVQSKRLLAVQLKRRGKSPFGSNTNDRLDSANNREIKGIPFKRGAVKCEDDASTVLIKDEELPTCKLSKKRLNSMESPKFWHPRGVRRKTAPEVSSAEYACLADEELEDQHSLAFENLGLECPLTVGNGVQGPVTENCSTRTEVPSFIA